MSYLNPSELSIEDIKGLKVELEDSLAAFAISSLLRSISNFLKDSDVAFSFLG